jgi:hypothetical protein
MESSAVAMASEEEVVVSDGGQREWRLHQNVDLACL